MAQDRADILHYYDFHPTEEDLMGETDVHRRLVEYLEQVLRHLFGEQACGVYANLNFYQTRAYKEKPLAPDIAVVKGTTLSGIRSWQVGVTGPAPQVVFEIASKDTWKKDVEEKPLLYRQLGVKEYFAYDPNMPIMNQSSPQRLFGWQLDRSIRVLRPQPVLAEGTLWSRYLESYLVPDDEYLRLYDNAGTLRQTGQEAAEQRAQEQEELAEEQVRRAEQERQARLAAERRAEQERQARLAAEQQAALLREKLRALGIDPDQP